MDTPNTDPTALADTYVQDLIQKKIAQRRQAPQIQAGVAQLAPHKFNTQNDLAAIASGLEGMRHYAYADQHKAEAQDVLNQKAAQANFNREQQLESNRIRNEGNLLKNAQMQQGNVETDIAHRQKQNQAGLQLEALQALEGVNKQRVEMGNFLNQAANAGLIKAGAGGHDWALTEKGKADKTFSSQFNAMPSVEDLVKDVETSFSKRVAELNANTDRYDDVSNINTAQLANNLLFPSTRSQKQAADIDAQEDVALQLKLKDIYGTDVVRNNVFGQNIHSLEEDLSNPAKSPLSGLTDNEEDTAEINSLRLVARNKASGFKDLSPEQQDYVLAKFLRDTEGAAGSKTSLFDISAGKWSDDAVEDDLGKYVLDFNKALDATQRAKQEQIKHQTKKARRNLKLTYGE